MTPLANWTSESSLVLTAGSALAYTSIQEWTLRLSYTGLGNARQWPGDHDCCLAARVAGSAAVSISC